MPKKTLVDMALFATIGKAKNRTFTLKSLKFGDLEPTEQDRINSLLLSKLYNELVSKA